MSLDGLRAWIGEVERKLGVRTRVFLVLTAIAVGGAGAGIYLSLEAQSSEVSEGDVQALEARLQEQITQLGAGGTATGADPAVTQLEAQVRALQAQVDALEEGGKAGGPAARPGKGEATSPSGKSGDSGALSPGNDGGTGTAGGNSSK